MAKAESLEAESAIRLTCKSNMALLFKTTGKYQEAISMFQELVEAYTRTLGHSHPSTLTVRHNLASTYKASGSPDLAASSLDPLPDLTPSTVQSYILAALCWKDLNDLPKANQIISKAEDFVNTTFGVGNSVNLLNAKGLIAKSSSDFILAEKCFLK
jgi:tetratricopeptide (TPR) repeat protein